MADYKSMYAVLFRSMTQAVDILQKAQQQTEEMYISSGDSPIRIFTNQGSEKKDGDHA